MMADVGIHVFVKIKGFFIDFDVRLNFEIVFIQFGEFMSVFLVRCAARVEIERGGCL